MKHSYLTLLILSLNALLDTGRYNSITIDEVEDRIRDGSILRFLRDRAGKEIDLSLQLSTPNDSFERFYVSYLQNILDCYGGNENRKWGVQNLGLCLLIAWTNEILQQGSDWRPEPDIAGVEYS